MRYYAVCNRYCVLTDDYSDNEIKNHKHIDNIIEDFKEIDYKGVVRIYDINDRFVCKLKNGAVYR